MTILLKGNISTVYFTQLELRFISCLYCMLFIMLFMLISELHALYAFMLTSILNAYYMCFTLYAFSCFSCCAWCAGCLRLLNYLLYTCFTYNCKFHFKIWLFPYSYICLLMLHLPVKVYSALIKFILYEMAIEHLISKSEIIHNTVILPITF